MELKDLVKDRRVKFDYYRASVMYYKVETEEGTYRFPVRLDDIGDASLMAEDKAILFMRYIRKAIESNELETLSPNS